MSDAPAAVLFAACATPPMFPIKPFAALRHKALPALVAARRSVRRLNIWSAASSTGQEAYSVAMLIREHFPELASWNVSIPGTDVSRAVLDQARAGRHTGLEVNRGLPSRFLTKYLTSVGAGWVVREDIRAMVQFRPLNLAKPWPFLPQMDLVFLRNVLIYLDAPTKRTIFTRVREVSAADSYLVLGAAESTLGLSDDFEIDRSEANSWYRQRRRDEVASL